MSAYIVDRAVVDALVSLVFDGPLTDRPVSPDTAWNLPAYLETLDRDAIGALLIAENVRSVRARPGGPRRRVERLSPYRRAWAALPVRGGHGGGNMTAPEHADTLRYGDLAVRVDALVDEATALAAGQESEGRPPDPDAWSLHARVDRAVSDYIGMIAHRGRPADRLRDTDPYTYLIVKAALTRRRRLNPLHVMAYARPFRPSFEALEDALLKPLVHEALDRELTADEREQRILGLLSEWIPMEDYPDEDGGKAAEA